MTFAATPYGLATGGIPYGRRQLQIDFDFVDHHLVATDGQVSFTIALEPKSVARFYRELMDGLRSLDIDVRIWPVPVEVAEAIPFESDEQHASYDCGHVEAFRVGLLQADRVMKTSLTARLSP